MSSEEKDQQPGPSGVSREEVLTLLGLNTSDDDDDDDDDDEEEEEEEEEETLQCDETLDDSEEEEEDRWCNLALDEFERQCEEEDHGVIKPWTILNVNVPFKLNSSNKAEGDWILKHPWAPLNLTWTPTWGYPPTPPGSRETPSRSRGTIFFLFKQAHHTFFHSTMSSEEKDQQPGPSGVSREEVLTLLGLNTSDDDDDDDDDDDEEEEEEEEETLQCDETLDDSEEEEEDRWCNLALDEFERQCEEEDHGVIKPWTILNVNVPFKLNSSNKAEGDWILKHPWAPLNLTWTPT